MHNYKEEIKILKQTIEILTAYSNANLIQNYDYPYAVDYLNSTILKLEYLDKKENEVK